jgi:glycosyltransferase involved in cell wall biosynthesis
MRIGLDLRLPTYRMGGISQYAIHLVQGLAELAMGEDEFLIFHSRKEGRTFLPDHPAFSRHDLWTPCHHRLERYALAAELAPFRLDVWHSPDFIPPIAGAKRRVITVHDLAFLRLPQFLTDESRRYYNDQIGWAVRAADAIAADSNATRSDILERLDVDPGKVRTIYLAANPIFEADVSAESVAATLARHGLEPGYILCVGTLEPRKNIPMLLRAYAMLRAGYDLTVPLVLAGARGWLDDEIFSTIRDLSLEAYVCHLAGLSDADLARLYHGAGVLAAPSTYEGFGLPPLEAMHCGCPIVASDGGSLPEVVGEAGLLISPDSPADWAVALARVLDDRDERSRLVAAGRVQARRFTWRHTAEQTLALYRGDA